MDEHELAFGAGAVLEPLGSLGGRKLAEIGVDLVGRGGLRARARRHAGQSRQQQSCQHNGAACRQIFHRSIIRSRRRNERKSSKQILGRQRQVL
jgi:hypothetical protein